MVDVMTTGRLAPDAEGALLDALPQGAAVFDREGTLRRLNRRLTDMLPADRAARLVPGLDFDAFLALLPPAVDNPAEGPVQKAALRSATGHLPVIQWSPAGGRRLELRSAPGADGAIIVLLTDVTDLARRNRDQDRLMAAIRIAPAPILVLDPDDRVFMWNGALVDINPKARMEVGLPFADLLRRYAAAGQQWNHAASDDWIDERLRRHRDYDGPFEEYMGDDRWYLTREQRMEDGSTLIMHVEITALRRAEAEARRAKEQADKANRAKTEFLANMSHELRTPLNAIMGFSEIIRDQTLGPVGVAQYADYAGDIHASGNHLLDLVNTILDLSKIEAGRFELFEDEVDLAEEVVKARRLIDLRADAAGLGVETVIADGLPPLLADRRAVRQMLLNLLSNAVRFTPAGGRVTIAAANGEDGGVTLSVADTGIGIAAQDIARALEPFGQVVRGRGAGALKSERSGTGLGLPLVKALIERHGGRFAIDSTEGRGTTVTLTFPAERRVG
jgi:signal transduction histidine kinase